jgi:hypothetical protein
METTRTQMKINLKKAQANAAGRADLFNHQNGLGSRNGATSPFFVRKSAGSSNSSHDGKSSHSGGSASPPAQKRQQTNNNTNMPFNQTNFNNRFNQMSINDLKSEKFSAPNSIIKERFFGSQNPHYNYNNNGFNRFGQNSVVKPNANNRLAQADFQDAQKIQQKEKAAQEATEKQQALQTLQQIQEAKPGNKRAILTDLPEYLYSIPALASFFEPYGEVAMPYLKRVPRTGDKCIMII